jgi:hypothetical protein
MIYFNYSKIEKALKNRKGKPAGLFMIVKWIRYAGIPYPGD